MTKDRDLRDAHLSSGSPRRLLVVATGTIADAAVSALFAANLDAIVAALDEMAFVEIGPGALVLHRPREDGPDRSS